MRTTKFLAFFSCFVVFSAETPAADWAARCFLPSFPETGAMIMADWKSGRHRYAGGLEDVPGTLDAVLESSYDGIYITVYQILSKPPINKLEDLAGKKVTLIGRYFSRWFEPLGTIPVVAPGQERYTDAALDNSARKT
jgi:hypothetical protein